MVRGSADGERGSTGQGLAARLTTEAPDGLELRAVRLEQELGEVKAELERSERRVEAMKEIGRALGSSLELDSLLDEIVRCTTELLEADRSTLFLLDSETGQLWSKVLEGEEHREIRLSPGAGVAGWVADSGRRLLITDAYEDDRFNRDFDQRSGYVTRDILACPVRRPQQGATIGVIQVLNKRFGRFDANDERLIEAIASEIGVALEVSALYGEALERNEALERARRELSLLFETERAISQSSEIEGTLGTILETAVTAMGALSGAIHVLDRNRLHLKTEVARGADARSLLDAGVVLGEGYAGRVIHTDEGVYANDLQGISRGRISVKSVLAVPIRDREQGTLGSLELLNTQEKRGAFGDDDVRTLTMVAAQAGRAIASERRRLQRDREERLSTIGQMLSGILHDLRTPMTLISGYTEVMAASADATARTRYAGLVERQIGLLTSMTKDLLAFARGERSLLVRKVYLHRFIEEMEEYLERELDSSGVKLELDLRYRGVARFDETKLRRVIQNIARNAREAMPDGGHFRVGVETSGGELLFTFQDDGPGIPAELEHSLFEPFSTAGKVGGTGLGLAMVRQIAEEHQGWVAAKPGADCGTCITVGIPLRK